MGCCGWVRRCFADDAPQAADAAAPLVVAVSEDASEPAPGAAARPPPRASFWVQLPPATAGDTASESTRRRKEKR